ncbi:MAG: carbohydrate ABC transporter permease [Clostridia bacterium]
MKRHGHWLGKTAQYTVLITLGLVLVFPLIYLFASSFKTNEEMFGSFALFPKEFRLDGYINGWNSVGQYTFGRYLSNSLILTLPCVVLTVASSLVVAYGFGRFEFPMKKVLFALMMALMMLPGSVLIIPRYLLFVKLNWVNSYMPFWIPSLLATSSFFIYMFVQFFRGLPYELDEAATIDGCGSTGVLMHVLLPLCTPAIISAAIFQFIWTWNDFMAQYIYLSSVSKYTVSLGLRMAIDGTARIEWSNVLAMSIVSMIPSTVVFLCLQKYFVEGIATSGLKG